MTTFQIIIMTYAIVSVLVFVFLIFPRRKEVLTGKAEIAFAIVLFAFMPFILIVGACKKIKNHMDKDKPLPVPKKHRKFIKPDIVVVNGQTMQLDEYNYRYGKDVKLEDVYGKKYVERLNLDKNNRDVNDCDSIPDSICKEYVENMKDAYVRKDFSDVRQLLSPDVTLVSFDSREITGVDQTIDYCLDWIERCEAEKVYVKYSVKWCRWFSQPALKIEPSGYKGIYLIPRIEDAAITHMMIVPIQIQYSSVGGPDLDWDRLEYDKCLRHLTDAISPKAKHLACLDCGTRSEALDWYRVSLAMGIHGYVGDMSVCPHCKKIIEFVPEIRLRFEKPELYYDECENN